MSKHIIKNCPSFCRDLCSADDTDCFCCNETNCVLKQIVELCKKEKILYEGDYIKVKQRALIPSDKILELLDIQEVE